MLYSNHPGEVAERIKATVSKTVVSVPDTAGSNPALSAILLHIRLLNGKLLLPLCLWPTAPYADFDRPF